MTQLRISKDLSLPLDAVTQKIAVLGMTGSGKSYCMTKLAEMMLDASAQVIFLDPKGEAWGLRLMADGKTPAYPIPVFGGDHADIPLKPDMGRRIADLLVDGDYSAVLDVSEFISSELAQFGYDFATRLFERKKRKPGAMSLMIDEVQDFIPQNPNERGMEPRMLAAFERVGKQLRSKGVGMVLAGQRPQEINKKVLNMCECWFAFQMTGLQERETMEKLIRDADRAEASKLKELLPTLETGHAHIWSPRWLKVSDTFLISEKKTFDSSATPQVGARRVEPRKLSPVDVASITAEMEEAIERAEKNDPVKLNRQIADLQKQLKNHSQRNPQVEKVVERVEVQVVKDDQLRRFEKACEAVFNVGTKLAETGLALTEIARNLRDVTQDITGAIKSVNGHKSVTVASVAERVTDVRFVARPISVETSKPLARQERLVSAPQQKILDSLAWFESVGITTPSRTNVAAIAGVSPRSSGFEKNVSTLRAHLGLIDYPQDGCLVLTDAGRGAARSPAHPGTLGDLHEAWLRSRALSNPQAELLRVLIGRYPHSISRDELANEVGRSCASSGFEKNVSTLSGLNLVTYPQPGFVVATKLLFPDGLS